MDDQGNIYFDNSMLDSFRACPRKYLYRHVLYWVPDTISHDLVFGLSWHAAQDVVWLNAAHKIDDTTLVAMAMLAFMDTWYEHYPLEKGNEDSLFASGEDERFPKTPGRAKDMLWHYVRRKRPFIAQYEILGVETPFIVPLPEFTNTFYIGRKDKTYRVEGKGVVDVDHKTSKADGQRWADTFFPNSQMDGYMYAGYLIHGDDYWGVEIDGALCQKGSAKSAREDYPPGIGFMTVPIQRTLGFVESWLWDTTFLIKQIAAHNEMLKACKPEDIYLRAYEKHTTACGYFKGCEYRQLCKFYENPFSFGEQVPRGFKVSKWSPFAIADVTNKIVDGPEE